MVTVLFTPWCLSLKVPTAPLVWSVVPSLSPLKKLAKALVVAIVAGGLSLGVTRAVPLTGSRAVDLESLGLVTVTWAAAVLAGLRLLQSDLPQVLRRKTAGATLDSPAANGTVGGTMGA